MVETRARDPPGTRITIQTGIRGKFQWVMKARVHSMKREFSV